MTSCFKKIAITSALFMSAVIVSAQTLDTLSLSEAVAVTARPTKDSITLRWAPLRLSVWEKGNKTGYVIERYVIARNGSVLATPDKTVLTPSTLKPLEEKKWEQLVGKNKYAAIAAQALFGERFEVDLSKTDVFTIVNKVRENEQRFAFALFSADMSSVVAKASGLWFTDKNIKKGEKYLYRIIIPAIDNPQALRGSIFVSPDDVYDLSKPMNLKAEFKDQLVSLKWDKNKAAGYTAYIVERSIDGKAFVSISDAPLVTVSPTSEDETRYEYATDSLKDLTKTYYYRVKGITPFGEESKPSNVVSGKGAIVVSDVPYIKGGENIDNKSIRVSWDFPEKNNEAIKGFSVERSSKPQGSYIPLTLQKPIPPTTRTFEDKAPATVNYYRVIALGVNGEQYRSPIFLAQLVDSIPPIAPVGLKATINEFGVVELSWEPNKDSDIYGYRIYKSNNEKEEPSQITSEPIALASYTDKANVNTLNESIYYSVMAIDRNQNHSELSALLKIELPDKIKPLAPAFLPVKSSEKGVTISWTRSVSVDVTQYELYRRGPDQREWHRLKIIPTTDSDSVFQYTDESCEAGKTHSYTVTAVDEAGLESDPLLAVSGGKIDNGLREPIQWNEPLIHNDQKQVVLTWGYEQAGVKMFRIYKAEGENPATMYRSLTGEKREFTDAFVIGKQCKYRILVIFENGNKSLLSEELLVKF